MENVEKRFVGFDLKKTHWCIKNFINQELDKEFHGDLAPSDAQLLSFLTRNQDKETTGSDLCLYFKISKATCSENLHRAEERGLITLKVPECDRRQKVVVLTKKGKEVAEKADEVFLSCQKFLDDCLSEEERVMLKSCLEKIRKDIENR